MNPSLPLIPPTTKILLRLTHFYDQYARLLTPKIAISLLSMAVSPVAGLCYTCNNSISYWCIYQFCTRCVTRYTRITSLPPPSNPPLAPCRVPRKTTHTRTRRKRPKTDSKMNQPPTPFPPSSASFVCDRPLFTPLFLLLVLLKFGLRVAHQFAGQVGAVVVWRGRVGGGERGE